MPQSNRLLQVEELEVDFMTESGPVRAVDGISFSVGQEKVGIVGESGSGKSTIGRAILRITPRTARVHARRLSFNGIDLLSTDEEMMRRIRGKRIGMILQDPKYSLNPVVCVGEQIAEVLRLHHRSSRKLAKEQTLSMIEAVHLKDPARVYKLYPHEVSGGMGQRIMIAMMLVASPELLIADEATSSLDVTVRFGVLKLLDELVSERGLGLIFISHDLNLVRKFCDRVVIMYAGRAVEALPANRLDDAEHPYTRGLLSALPRIHSPRSRLPVLHRDPYWKEAPSVVAP